MDADLAPNVAGRWFGLRAEFAHVGRHRMVWEAFKSVALGGVTWGLLGGDVDPKRRCDVTVFRRDTGQGVAVFSYDFLSEAEIHVNDLMRRFAETQVFDLCRQLGISTDAVAGEGSATPLNPTTIWREVPAEDLASQRYERAFQKK